MIIMKKIHNESEYDQALKSLEQIFDAKSGSEESDEADVLALIIEDYENENYSIDLQDPIEAIKIRMEELGISKKQLGELIGRSKVSGVLNKKRKLTLNIIRTLSKTLNLSSDLLIQDYELKLKKMV